MFFIQSHMDLIFDTPAIDLLDYGCNDEFGSNAYYWQIEEEVYLDDLDSGDYC
jgi:hypothetical protein